MLLERAVPRTIPSYRRHKASGQAVVTLNGVDIYLGPWNTSQSRAEYDRVVNEWLALGRRLPDRRVTGSDGWLIKELIAGYHAYCVATKLPLEVDKVKWALQPVLELYGATPAQDFGPVAFKAVRQRMVDAGLTISTIRNRLGVIRRMIAWGVENERLSGDALYRLQAVAGLRVGQPGVKAPKKVKPVPAADLAAILPYLGPTVRAMVQVQALTGMRPGEVIRMTTGQIDRTTDPWLYKPAKHKTMNHGVERVIPLGPQAQELLTPWLRADPNAALFSPREARQHFNANHPTSGRTTAKQRESWRRYYRKHSTRPASRERTMYSTQSYGNSVENACRRAGVPLFRPNRIRHLYATRVRQEYGLEAAQVLLGHTQADVTQVYAERDLAKAVAVAKKIG
jgi:integrase